MTSGVTSSSIDMARTKGETMNTERKSVMERLVRIAAPYGEDALPSLSATATTAAAATEAVRRRQVEVALAATLGTTTTTTEVVTEAPARLTSSIAVAKARKSKADRLAVVAAPPMLDDDDDDGDDKMVFTTAQLNFLDNKLKLAGYPKSRDFVKGYNFIEADCDYLAMTAFKRGAENKSCVPSMYCYLIQLHMDPHLALPWALETAIRGCVKSMDNLVAYYNRTTPKPAFALINFWIKMMIALGVTYDTHEKRIRVKRRIANSCITCGKKDSEDKTFNKCGKCKYYSYCSKACQVQQWTTLNHSAECRQLKILNTCCKPRHVQEIRDAIMNGADPTTIPRLQNLRTDLGLNQPSAEYEELLSRFVISDDDDNNIGIYIIH